MSIIPRKPAAYTVPPFDELTILIFGVPGSGKTLFCGGASDNLFLSTEPGTNYTKCPTVPIKNWNDFMAVIQEFVELKKGIAAGNVDPDACPYTSFTIDIIDTLAAYCRDHVCREKGLAYPPANDYGKTWSEVTNLWKKWIGILMRLGPVRFISHCSSQPDTIAQENGMNVEVEVKVPTFTGSKTAQYLDGIVCAMGYCSVNKAGQFCVTFKKTAEVGAKDRTNILCQCGPMINAYGRGWQDIGAMYAAKAKEMGLEIKSKRG